MLPLFEKMKKQLPSEILELIASQVLEDMSRLRPFYFPLLPTTLERLEGTFFFEHLSEDLLFSILMQLILSSYIYSYLACWYFSIFSKSEVIKNWSLDWLWNDIKEYAQNNTNLTIVEWPTIFLQRFNISTKTWGTRNW